MNNHYLVQIGYAVFGVGDDEQAAYADALSNGADLPPIDRIGHLTGHAATADRAGHKNMTELGEMHIGEMVFLNRDQAEGQGFDVSIYD